MDHVFDSEESSSGCESGWTLYLDHSCKHAFATHEHNQEHDEQVEEDHDDDMSMVSDASSGPPHFQEHQEQDEDEDEYNNDNINDGYCDPMMFGSRKRRKVLEQTSFYGHRHLQDLPASLDDTASSPFFTFCNKDLKVCTKEGLMEDDNSFDYSQGHSTTYFEV
ncbi:protein SOB FIVE-LIKE 5-like [Bidens hawaiensis]|uniref:protein SOB FIVE-LIKE 5-like n=1 Tax=Bidens hawaiensis TaxID=980011 RepID=UPI0040494AEE